MGRKSLSTEEFIQKAKEIHGSTYEYNNVQYFNAKTKVLITCKTHGDFEQTPNSHLSRYGCPKCYGNEKLTTEEFIQKAKEIHGSTYQYNNVQYINNRTKVLITCKTHGGFEQTPAGHLHGRGCLTCSGNKKLSTESFITRAKEIHGSIYQYHNVKYISARKKVLITCPVHGDFEQTPHIHLNGSGCLRCVNNRKTLSTEEFIQKAKEIHGSTYEYNNVQYNGTHKKIHITCQVHGDFEQTPNSHLSRYGCPKCYGNEKLTTKSFIEKSKEIHGSTYQYNNVQYINNSTKVNITCKIHGDFEQIPNNHLNGKGCPTCKGHTQQQGYIHIIYDNKTPIALKYGIANKASTRQKQQHRKSVFEVVLLGVWEYNSVLDCKKAEKQCKKLFGKGILTKEELPDGYTETTGTDNLEKIIAIYESFGAKKKG